MKMTDADERALAAIEDAIRTSSYGAFASGRTALIEARDHIRARLAADQQKGGGECNCSSGHGAEHCVVHAPNGSLAAFDAATSPQPSIPAPAQQDGKASGGECAHRWVQDDEHPNWACCQLCNISRRKHADQEPQG